MDIQKECRSLVLVAKGSKIGEVALEKAVDLYEKFKCSTLKILLVLDTDFFSTGLSGYTKARTDAEIGFKHIDKVIFEKLENRAKQINKDINIEKVILKGKTAEEILKYVKRHNDIYTIIIPQDERGPIEKSLVGGEIAPFFEEISKYTKLVVVK